MWNKLGSLEKGEYQLKAKHDKDRYEEEMAQIPNLPPSAIIESKKPRVRRAKKDKNKPKKALSPYILFVKERRPLYTADKSNSSKSFAEIMRAMGDEWKNLPAREK